MGQHLSQYLPSVAVLSNITNMSNGTNTNGGGSGSGSGTGFKDRRNNPTRRRYNYRKMAKDNKLTENELQQITYDVLELIFEWFPELHERTYFLPPVHMNKLQYKHFQYGGKEVHEIQSTPESDWRDDEVMQRTLCCIRALTDHRQEAMVVLLQMQHDNYLNRPCYTAAASQYPRPVDLPPKLRRGDFDMLFIHGQHGLLVAEIKSVGWRPGGEQDDQTVKKKVNQALEQLNKAQVVLGHLVSDLKPTPRITKTLILPNVPSSRLRRLLREDLQFSQNFHDCFFNVSDVEDAISICLCSDQMAMIDKPADITPAILKQLEAWWCCLMASGGALPGCTPEVYELLVARFCGPASTVQVHCVRPPRLEFRTLGHAVHEVGERMVQFALFPEQLALLQDLEEACVYLTGPPGTGKTLMLMLVAMQWARRGHHVHVVSTSTFSEAATHLLYYQVTKTLEDTDGETNPKVHLHLNGNNTGNVHRIIDDLIAASAMVPTAPEGKSQRGGRQLYVVVDEAGEKFCEFFHELREKIDDLHLWAASYRNEFRPGNMEEKVLTACLRSTPVVKRRMETAISFARGVEGYEDRSQDYLSPTDGPAELFLSHEDHPPGRAMDCEQCGQAIADCLHHELGIGKSKPRNRPANSVKTPPPLNYSDVIVIPDYYQDIENLHDDANNNNKDNSTSAPSTCEASGIVRGLRSHGVPTYIVTKNDGDRVRDLARAARQEVAVVAWGVSNGLERKVVVSVGQGRPMSDGRVSGVLHGASRCVSQLIYIMCPLDDIQ